MLIYEVVAYTETENWTINQYSTQNAAEQSARWHAKNKKQIEMVKVFEVKISQYGRLTQNSKYTVYVQK